MTLPLYKELPLHRFLPFPSVTTACSAAAARSAAAAAAAAAACCPSGERATRSAASSAVAKLPRLAVLPLRVTFFSVGG